jgi:NTE family protein
MARVGLVLGGGGILGTAFHAGVLAGLAEATGWDPASAEVVIGTSAGSVTGAGLRAGLSPAELLDAALGQPVSSEGLAALVRLSPTLLATRPAATGLAPDAPTTWPGRRDQVLSLAKRPWRARPALLLAAAAPEGRADGTALARLIDELAPDGWPDAPLWLTAARLPDLERVVLGADGSPAATVGQAVAASCAVPAMFRPVEIGDARYVDGGVHSSTNADLLAPLHLDVVVVSAPLSTAAGLGQTGVVERLARRQCWRDLRREAARLRAAGTTVLAVEPSADDLRAMAGRFMDDGRRPRVAETARRSTLALLEDDADAGAAAAALR